jgi:hypothetical protein
MRLGILLLALGTAMLADSAAGLKWAAPAGWISKGSTAMRAATYQAGDSECVVYFFGAGQGGSVEANLTRWSGQFTIHGQPAPAKTAKKTIHGLNVTTMDVSGTYVATGGMNMTAQAPQADSRMLAAIVEGPGGTIFIKYTGPRKTIESNADRFDALLASFQKE